MRPIASPRSESFTCDNYLVWTLSMPAACARAAKDPLELVPEDARQLGNAEGPATRVSGGLFPESPM